MIPPAKGLNGMQRACPQLGKNSGKAHKIMIFYEELLAQWSTRTKTQWWLSNVTN
jgi:hypothetical protein